MKKNTIIMMGIILIYGIAYFIFGETVPQNGGFGWDGMVYKLMTQKFLDLGFISGLDQYQFQRIFIPGFLHFILRFSGIQLNDINILWAYKLLNLIELLICVFFYNRIVNELKLKNKVIWLGFYSLFISYSVLKQSFYYAVLLDISIFTISIIQIYFYFRKNLTGLVITTILGAFTWPSFLYASLILILFPIKKGEREIRIGNNIKWVIISLTLMSLLIGCYISNLDSDKVLIFGVSRINKKLLPFSVLLMLLYVFFALKPLLSDKCLYEFKSYFKNTSLKNILIAFLLFVSINALIGLHHPRGINIFWVTKFSLLTANTQPMIFLLSNIVYFGPIIILIFFYWKDISFTVHKYGLGLTFYFIFYSLMSLNSESRHFINAVPFYIFITLIIINKYEIKSLHILIYILFSLLFSKFWFLFNISVFSNGDNGELQEFPAQKYFMNHGPWMSFEMYILQGIVILLTGTLIFYIMKKHYSFSKTTD